MEQAAHPRHGPSTGTPGGRLSGVGVGPGDPDLLTGRALRVLAAADRVVAPTSGPDQPGRAESIVLAAMPGLAMTRLPFDMTNGQGGQAARERSCAEAARALVPWLEAGEHVAFITLGDPNIYSTFSSLAAAVRAHGCDAPVDTVPGITAFQDLAARSGTVLLDGTESLSLVTALDGPGQLADALSIAGRAIVIYKGGRHVPRLAELLERHGRLDGAVLGELMGLPGERIVPLADAADRPAAYLATVVVPAVPGSGR